jgi:hypothetical protein
MRDIYQVSRVWRRMVWPVRVLFAGIVTGLWLPVAAHDIFTNYVQHSVHLTVGARHLDLTLDLTFFEEWSARERQLMDADTNGRITRSELESYLKQRAAQLSRQVKVRVAGRELPLVPLYDPEVDLMANDQTGPGHHRLRLCFFAPTPPDLRTGDEIVVEDSLWLRAKILSTVQAEGRDGCTLTTEIPISPDLASARSQEERLLKVRCLKPPPRIPPETLSAPTTQTVP